MKIYDYSGRANISGDRIHQARTAQRLSQDALAAKMQVYGVGLGREAISRIERNEEGKRNWLSKKEKKKVKKVSLWKITKESFDLNALCEFPNLEVIEIAGFDEFKPLELKHIEVLYQFRRLKCLRLSSCLIPEPFEKGKWKHLRTLEID